MKAPSLGSQGNPARPGAPRPQGGPAGHRSQGRPRHTASRRTASLRRPLLRGRQAPAAPPRPSAADGDGTAPSHRGAPPPHEAAGEGRRVAPAEPCRRARGRSHLSAADAPQPNTR